MIEKYINEFREIGPTVLAGLSADEQTAVATWAREVVDQYGTVINSLPMKIKDSNDLPHAKETIKIAIKTLVQAYALTESKDMLTLLKERYVRLSSFQEIDAGDKKIIYTEAGDTNQAQPTSDFSFNSTRQKYMQLVLSEEKILLEDIETYLSDL
jgi:hypothetical protein